LPIATANIPGKPSFSQYTVEPQVGQKWKVSVLWPSAVRCHVVALPPKVICSRRNRAWLLMTAPVGRWHSSQTACIATSPDASVQTKSGLLQLFVVESVLFVLLVFLVVRGLEGVPCPVRILGRASPSETVGLIAVLTFLGRRKRSAGGSKKGHERESNRQAELPDHVVPPLFFEVTFYFTGSVDRNKIWFLSMK
jgi:hypothetical protein